MDRFTTFTSAPVPEESGSLLAEISPEYGFVPNLLKGMAPAPETVEAYRALSKAFESSTLTPEEQQIVLLTVSRFNESEYGTSVHSLAAESTSLDWATIERIRSRQPLENERYEALRRFTERVVKNGGMVPRDEWSDFIGVGFDVRNALDVVLGVTLKTLTNSVSHLVGTPLDPQFEKRAWTVERAKTVHA